jgi:polar amino acid transport system substrate-binding protein
LSVRSAAAVAAAAALAALAALAPGCGGGGNGGRIRVAVDATYPPFESVDASGAIVGFDVELVRAVARETGLEVEVINQPFAGILPGLAQGKYDAVISCLTITPERAKEVDFSRPYYDAGQVIAVREADASVRSLADLKGKTIAAQIGTTGFDAASRVEGATPKAFKEIELAYLELLAGRADAVINDEPPTRIYLKDHGGIRIVGPPFTEERYGIAVRKGNADLLAKIDAGLAKVAASGEFERLKVRWIGK